MIRIHLEHSIKEQKEKARLRNALILPFRYIIDVLSLNNPYFSQYLHLIYSSELEIKNTTDTRRTVPYLDLFLNIDTDWRLRIKMTNGMISTSQWSNSNLSAGTFPLPRRIVLTYLDWCIMLVHFLSIQECAPYAESAPTELWGRKIKDDTLLIYFKNIITVCRCVVFVSKLTNNIFTTS